MTKAEREEYQYLIEYEGMTHEEAIEKLKADRQAAFEKRKARAEIKRAIKLAEMQNELLLAQKLIKEI